MSNDKEKLAHRDRRVSTTLKQVLTEFGEIFHVTWTGLLIQTSLGRSGGLGALRGTRLIQKSDWNSKTPARHFLTVGWGGPRMSIFCVDSDNVTENKGLT
jgi:hypothetical protein